MSHLRIFFGMRNFDSSQSFPTLLLNEAEATAAPLRSRQPERALREGRALCFLDRCS